MGVRQSSGQSGGHSFISRRIGETPQAEACATWIAQPVLLSGSPARSRIACVRVPSGNRPAFRRCAPRGGTEPQWPRDLSRRRGRRRVPRWAVRWSAQLRSTCASRPAGWIAAPPRRAAGTRWPPRPWASPIADSTLPDAAQSRAPTSSALVSRIEFPRGDIPCASRGEIGVAISQIYGGDAARRRGDKHAPQRTRRNRVGDVHPAPSRTIGCRRHAQLRVGLLVEAARGAVRNFMHMMWSRLSPFAIRI